jgi:triacylglycerol lipase
VNTYFSNASLLKTPTKRAAYSDRTAYMMAEMSRLAYFRFEGGRNIEEIIKSVKSLTSDSNMLAEIEDMIKFSLIPEGAETGKKLLGSILEPQGFEVVQTFNNTETDAQAFICRNPTVNMAVLAFRGTERNLKDIKADVQANLVETSVGTKKFLMHNGYLNQFNSIKDDILSVLQGPEIAGYQLFITGHSLGGALAITATRFLANDHTAACYTYGSPPVGTDDFDSDITTPIYRIINHVDIVPRLPNPTLVFFVRSFAVALGFVLDMFGGISQTIRNSAWYKKASQLLNDAQKYRQSGYCSYLVGDGANTRLRYSVSYYDRFGWWMKQMKNLFKKDFELVTDHSIETYSKKLADWANYRQQQKQ